MFWHFARRAARRVTIVNNKNKVTLCLSLPSDFKYLPNNYELLYQIIFTMGLFRKQKYFTLI